MVLILGQNPNVCFFLQNINYHQYLFHPHTSNLSLFEGGWEQFLLNGKKPHIHHWLSIHFSLSCSPKCSNDVHIRLQLRCPGPINCLLVGVLPLSIWSTTPWSDARSRRKSFGGRPTGGALSVQVPAGMRQSAQARQNSTKSRQTLRLKKPIKLAEFLLKRGGQIRVKQGQIWRLSAVNGG